MNSGPPARSADLPPAHSQSSNCSKYKGDFMNDPATQHPSGLFEAPLDADPQETREWVESLQAVLDTAGPERAHHLLRRLHESLQTEGVALP